MVLSTLSPDPLIVRNGALVYPIICSADYVSLNAKPIDITSELKTLLVEKFSQDFSTITVQVSDDDESILKAHKRISTTDENEKSRQLESIVNSAVREQLKLASDYEGFKSMVNSALSKVGFELIV